MRPLQADLFASALPVGEYCNALGTLNECLEEAEDEAEDEDRLRELAMAYSQALLGVIQESVCSFMPETGGQCVCVCVCALVCRS